jgi:hypothetical protein
MNGGIPEMTGHLGALLEQNEERSSRSSTRGFIVDFKRK